MHAAQFFGVVVAHAVQNGRPVRPGQHTLQKLVPLCAVAAALAACTVHDFAGIVQQPAKGGLQGKKIQTIISFAFETSVNSNELHKN